MKFSYKEYLEAERKYETLNRKSLIMELSDEEMNEKLKFKKTLNKLNGAKKEIISGRDEEEDSDSIPLRTRVEAANTIAVPRFDEPDEDDIMDEEEIE